MSRSNPCANRIGFAYFSLLAMTVIGQYAASAVVTGFFPALIDANAYPWLMALLPLYCLGLPLCLAILRPLRAEPYQTRKISVRHWLLALMLSLGLMVFGNLIGNALMMLISVLRGTEPVNPVQEIILAANPLWTAIATVIVAPLGEEFLFRRLIIDRTRRFGELPAILLSAAMFGAFHLNLYQFFYAFLIGLVFGYVYCKTGRLRYTVALHAAINLLGSVIAPALLRAILPLMEQFGQGGVPLDAIVDRLPALLLYLAYTALLFACALSTLIVGIALHRKLAFSPGEGGRPLWRSPTVWAFFSLCAVMMLSAM